MQFTRAEEYGMLGVLHLAEKDVTSITPLSEISEAREIPEKFLAKIFQSLSRAGIVVSHRGVRGGFSLGNDPNKISVKQVLEAIQGPYHLMKCTSNNEYCDRQPTCALRDLLVIAEKRLVGVFADHTIADLLSWQLDKSIG
ncbi:MAG: RrF2 family transcriptional regulator [Candidatus Zixiibacteriota bacterium]